MGQNQSVLIIFLLACLRDYIITSHCDNLEDYCDVILVAMCHKFWTTSILKYEGNVLYFFQWSIPLNHWFYHYRGNWEFVAEDKYRSLQSAMQANARVYFCLYLAACLRELYLWCNAKIASAAEFTGLLFWHKPIVHLVQFPFLKNK